MKKKIKLEFFDRKGTKHSVSIEGEFSMDNLRKLLEYAEIVAGSTPSQSVESQSQQTKMNRLVDVINTRLPDRPFDSREICDTYREAWGEDFSLGAMSTYLSRLADRGTLDREGSPSHWKYRLKTSPEFQH